MVAFYNEIDPYCAQWLRNMIAAGLIPDGVVDERSIEDIAPDELAGFDQCHFFAGLGGWPLALQRSGWPDNRPTWTGSCPCQPFSPAGKGKAFADQRHLWPAFDWLIGQCLPDLVLGEQVEGPAGRKWLDLAATDMEGHGYAFGTAVFPAAGVGAPQIIHRTYWVADRCGARLAQRERIGRVQSRALGAYAGQAAIGGSDVSRLASANEGQCGRLASGEGCELDGSARGWQQSDRGSACDCEAGWVGDADSERPAGQHALLRPEEGGRLSDDLHEVTGRSEASRPGPVNGFWRSSDWLYCRDDKWRPVEPGTFPLASGAPARVGRLRAYGNAICVPQAVAFIESVMSALHA